MDIKIPKTKTYAPDVEIVGDSYKQVRLTYDITFNDLNLSDFFNNSTELKELGAEEGFDEWRTNFEQNELKQFFIDKFKEFMPETPGDVETIEIDVDLFGDHADAMWGNVQLKVWINIQDWRFTEAVSLVIEDLK